MLLGRVVVAVGVVGQGRVDTALGGAGVAAAGVHLAEHGDVDAGQLGLHGGAQPGQAAADHQHLMAEDAHVVIQGHRAQRP